MPVAVTQVNEVLDASETDISVLDNEGFPTVAFTARVDSEWLRITAGFGTATWTATRGYNSTTAATHLINAPIYHVPTQYPALDRILRRLQGPNATVSTSDQTLLQDFIGQAHDWMTDQSQVGMFLGPTTSTSIDVDGAAALAGGKVLYIPFGIQSLTTLSVAPATGDTFETVTAADYYLGPRAWEQGYVSGWPYRWIRFKDVVDGSWDHFPTGIQNVRIAGTLGWSAPPEQLGELGDTLVIRMFEARNTGQRDLVGTDEAGNALISRFLSLRDRDVLRRFRSLVSDFRYV